MEAEPPGYVSDLGEHRGWQPTFPVVGLASKVT